MTNNKEEFCAKREGSSNKYSLNSQSSKRLSFIDKGKSWAKQFIKSNRLPNSPSLTAHKSFDSCDSGIDVNSYSSNSSKISTSSSCSFITNLQSDYNSNSSYQISPIDESGYLVPVINYSLNNNNQKSKIPYRKPSSSHGLIRSFSTRSAYTPSQHSNNQILSNRATICEQIRTTQEDVEYCIRCNSKLSSPKKCDSSFSFNHPIEEELVKSNQSYSLFQSFTCDSCLQSTTTTKTDKLKVPSIRAPSPPLLNKQHLSRQPAPPLPTQPPPSLQNLKITPLLICTQQNNQIYLKETKLLTSQQSNCNCACCLKNYLNSQRSSTPEFEAYLGTNTLNLSNIKTEPLIYIDSGDSTDMNFLNKFKSRGSKQETKMTHDYHHIDDKKLTPSDRVESFEFINLQPNVIKYEPSWEESTIVLVNNLRDTFDQRCSLRRENNIQQFQRNVMVIPQRASYPLQTSNHQQLNNSDEIERLLSGSLSDSDSKTLMTTSSENSLDDSIDLETAAESWFQPDMPRENVLNYLIGQEIGSFLIRLSTSCKNCFALSIRVPYFANQNGVAHYLITKNRNGYKLKGVDKEFRTLKSLVTHYSVMQEILPVTLNLNNGRLSNNTQILNCLNQIKKPTTFLSQHHANIKNVSCLIK